MSFVMKEEIDLEEKIPPVKVDYNEPRVYALDFLIASNPKWIKQLPTKEIIRRNPAPKNAPCEHGKGVIVDMVLTCLPKCPVKDDDKFDGRKLSAADIM